MVSTVVLEKKWPVLIRHEQAASWLRVWTDLGRAPRTIDAYARGLAEYLVMCERTGVDPMTAKRAQSFAPQLSRPRYAPLPLLLIDLAIAIRHNSEKFLQL